MHLSKDQTGEDGQKRHRSKMTGLTKSSKDSELSHIVRHGTHKPIRIRLPHRIKESTENH